MNSMQAQFTPRRSLRVDPSIGAWRRRHCLSAVRSGDRDCSDRGRRRRTAARSFPVRSCTARRVLRHAAAGNRSICRHGGQTSQSGHHVHGEAFRNMRLGTESVRRREHAKARPFDPWRDQVRQAVRSGWMLGVCRADHRIADFSKLRHRPWLGCLKIWLTRDYYPG